MYIELSAKIVRPYAAVCWRPTLYAYALNHVTCQ